ncbi:MAG TPA: glutathione S-transferase N-terminal domain-containing protein [Burkholderiaceae bacterium]|nr:glutathione S-transferase N-terminal domain-containing protein [Burkholderiaceae bacterium]
MRLHVDPRSSASRRVLAYVAHKGIDVEVVRLDLLAGDHHDVAYRSLNPSCSVPALELDADGVVTQSLAIMELLESLHPAPALVPADPVQLARMRSLCGMVASDIHPLTNLRVRQEIARLASGDASVQWVRHWTELGLAALDAWLGRYAGRCAVGDQLTLAEFFIAPAVANGRSTGCNIEDHREVARIFESCLQLSAFSFLKSP